MLLRVIPAKAITGARPLLMLASPDAKETTVRPKPFRKAVLKGLALIAPPLLTLVLFLWAWNTIEGYILRPLENTARYLIFVSINDIKTEAPGRPVGATGDSVGRQKFADEKGSVWVQGKQALPMHTRLNAARSRA